MAMNPIAMYTSSGQTFTQRGRASRVGVTYARDQVNDWKGAIDDMAALNARLLVIGADTAVQLADELTQNTKDAIRRHMPPSGWRPRESTGEPFEFSKGRLMAAWGRYTPESMRGQVDEVDKVPIQYKHERWARQNGVAGGKPVEGRDTGEEVEVNMGATTEIKRIKGNVWTAEVGTYLPYASLANDGGTMWIYPYGNRGAKPVQAHWEGVKFVEEGIAVTEGKVDKIVEGTIQEALEGQPDRRRVRNPRRRG
jgi:hypothetical protein